MKTNRNTEHLCVGTGRATQSGLRILQCPLAVKGQFDASVFTSIEKLPIIYANIRV